MFRKTLISIVCLLMLLTGCATNKNFNDDDIIILFTNDTHGAIDDNIGFARNQSGKHYTNGIAESINNQLKTITKSAYGYRNFDRFRKRAMMIITYKLDNINQAPIGAN